MLKRSCGLTLALKYRCRTLKKVFKQFGTHFQDPAGPTVLWYPETLAKKKSDSALGGSTPPLNSIIRKSWTNKLTTSPLGKPCVICGSGVNVEMHHVKHLRGLKARELDWLTMQIAAINRKQVPLCREHHVKLHKQALDPSELTRFKEGCRQYVKTVGKPLTKLHRPKVVKPNVLPRSCTGEPSALKGARWVRWRGGLRC